MTELTISEQTQELINNLAEYRVRETYGHEDRDALKDARLIALAAVKFDLSGQVEEPHRDAIAHNELNRLTREALEARRCQCHRIAQHGVCQHQAYAECPNYHELDVPEIDDAKLCGACYIAVADGRGLPIAEQ